MKQPPWLLVVFFVLAKLLVLALIAALILEAAGR